MDVLAPILGTVGILATLGWILRSYLSHRRQLKTTALQAELQGKLLDRFSSAEDLHTYLNSDVGERFLLSTTIEQASPLRRILGSVQVGLILTAAGMAFLIMESRFADTPDSLGMIFIGTLSLALGIGFLVSAAVSTRLSRNWGLINGQKTDES
ncbi:MAG: hypothetical protein WBN87_10545 [Thermoanaerobaculia bacterium]